MFIQVAAISISILALGVSIASFARTTLIDTRDRRRSAHFTLNEIDAMVGFMSGLLENAEGEWSAYYAATGRLNSGARLQMVERIRGIIDGVSRAEKDSGEIRAKIDTLRGQALEDLIVQIDGARNTAGNLQKIVFELRDNLEAKRKTHYEDMFRTPHGSA